MQTMAAVSQLRGLPPLGTQSSGLFGDVKAANLTFSPPKEVPTRTAINVRATYSNFGPNSPVPPRNNEQPPMPFQNAPPVPPQPQPAVPPFPPQGSNSFTNDLQPRPSATAPGAPAEKQFTSARPPSSSPGGLGLNFPGNQIPGLPGSPRPKPGTPRPYDPTKQKSKVMEWLTPPPPPTELLQREHFRLSPACTCTIYFGDLSKWTVDGKSDAVIAPANKRLNTGPAVNAVLFKAAGSRLLDATQRLPDVAPQGIKAEVGDAISTRAFNLPVSRVIHTVGPVYKKNDQSSVRESDESLIKAYKSALTIAKKENLIYLAFPPLSCRIYGYPYIEGAEVALKTLKENCEGFTQIDIVIRNIEGYEAFIDEATKVLEVIKEKKTIKIPGMGPQAPAPAAEAAAATAPVASTGLDAAPPQQAPPQTTPVEPIAAPVQPIAAPGFQSPAASGYQSSAGAPGFQNSAAGFQSSAAAPGYQSSGGAPGFQSSAAAPGFQSSAGATGFQSSAAAPGHQNSAAAAPNSPPPSPPQFQSPYSANYQQAPPPPQFQATGPPSPPAFQGASQSNQYQRGGSSPPQYQSSPPQFGQQQQSGPPPFQQYNQGPYQSQQQQQPQQYQQNPSQYQQNPAQYQQNPPQYQQNMNAPPAPPPPPPPSPPQGAPIPPWQQKYVPPPPPPPPESTPVAPRDRASPFPPANRPPRQPSSPTSTYEQPLY